MTMFKESADIQTADMLNLPVPDVEYITVVASPSEHQKGLVQSLSERAGRVQRREVAPNIDNMLKITTDGRKIGLDQRLIDPLLPDFPGSKINMLVENVTQIWQDSTPEKLAQLIFCDFSTPSKGFNIYDDIKQKLIANGIPQHEIKFIHDAKTEDQKDALFADVNAGKVRILLGSTQKMGAGTNVQKRLVAIHDADCPWRPSDLSQRAGRVVRQGNENENVKIYRYVTKNTFDAYLWQTVEKKQKFISQIMTSKSPARSCEDIDETTLSYAEIKALCAGNPLISEKMNLDIEVARLRMLKADHQSQQYQLEDKLSKSFPGRIAAANEQISGLEADILTYTAEKEKTIDLQSSMSGGAVSVTAKFPGMVVGGMTYTEKEPAAKALIEACSSISNAQLTPIGRYMGFDMSLQFDSFSKQFILSLKGKLSHRLELGEDAFGNITRINNILSGLPAKLEDTKNTLSDILQQQAAAKTQLERPFELADELAEKELKLAEINTQLDIGATEELGDIGESDDGRSDVLGRNDAERDDDEISA